MGRCGVGAVDNLEGVVALSGGILRQQYYVAELQSRHADAVAVGRRHIFAGELAEGVDHLGIFLWGECLPGPFLIFLLADQCRFSVLHKLGEGSLGVGAEYGALRLNHPLQLLAAGGQSVDLVALAAEAQQQVVERGAHLHAGGGKGVLSGAFIIVNGHALLAVGLVLQRDIIVDGLHEGLQPFGYGVGLLQSLAVDAVPEEYEGAYGAVDFGRYDALREESATHPQFVLLPLVDQSVDVEWGE